MARKIKIRRQARDITIPGGEEVYTRYSQREYERRQEMFDDPAYWNPPAHLADYSYQEWTEWGSQGGRPRKWANEAEGKRAQRAQKKLEQGRTLTQSEKELLGLVKPRPQARKYHPDRKASPQERKARWREKHKSRSV